MRTGGNFEPQPARPLEKLKLARIGCRVARLDYRYAEIVQHTDYLQPVVDGKGYSLTLSAVAQGRIEQFDFFNSLPPVSVVYDRVAALKSGYARARKLGYSVDAHVRDKRVYSLRLARQLRREHRVTDVLDPRAVGYDGL